MSDQPAAIPLPRYTPAYVYTCQECFGDLTHEGVDSYWCPSCRRSWLFTEVGVFDEGYEPGDY